MFQLVKRDFTSITNVMTIFLAVVFFYVVGISFFIDDQQLIFPTIFFSYLLTVFFSYGFVSQMCVVEELNGVNIRLKQLPISQHTIVLSRYLSSIITIVVLLTIFMSVTVLIISLKNYRVTFEDFREMKQIFYLLIGILFFFFAVYLPFYFGKSASAGSWATRISLIVWGGFYLKIENYIYINNRNTNKIALVEDYWIIAFFLTSFLVLIFSIYFSNLAYRKNTVGKPVLKVFTTYFLVIVILYLGAFVVANEMANGQIKPNKQELTVSTSFEGESEWWRAAYVYQPGPIGRPEFIHLTYKGSQSVSLEKISIELLSRDVIMTGALADMATIVDGNNISFLVGTINYSTYEDDIFKLIIYDKDQANELILERK